MNNHIKSPRHADFAIGTFGCHEALHMTAFLANAVEEELCGHTAIELKPEWSKFAREAADALNKLYQAIGAEHL